MITLRSNLSSIITQQSLSDATNKLNLALERMSTGFKINHAKDNAANYSISTNMTTKIGGYQVAQDNVAMGLDMLTTASDTISLLQSKAGRLLELSTQARNGTYGKQSLKAIQTEADAIVREINRLYQTAEYNGVKLLDRPEYDIPEYMPRAGENGFIEDFTVDQNVYTNVKSISKVDSFTSGEVYSISSAKELKRLADLVNSGKNTTGATFVLTDDIDLSEYENWTPIGDYSTNTSYVFRGTFDGNGHTISNLTINNPDKNYQGLFGYAFSAIIKNFSLENVDIKGYKYIGGLVGYAYTTNIDKVTTSGSVIADDLFVGGIIGTSSYATSSNLSSSCAVKSVNKGYAGGIAGSAVGSVLYNLYSTGDVIASEGHIGGLVGSINSTSVTSCYSTGEVIHNTNLNQSSSIGGLIGSSYDSSVISNCFSNSNVQGKQYAGGLIGSSLQLTTVKKSYATGTIKGGAYVGGLFGQTRHPSNDMIYEDCAFYGNVSATISSRAGNIVGAVVNTSDGVSFTNVEFKNCTAIESDLEDIGCVAIFNNNVFTIMPDYDETDMQAGIKKIEAFDNTIDIQAGIHQNENSRIGFDTGVKFNYFNFFKQDITSDDMYEKIFEFVNILSAKATEIGAVQNRLESALDEIGIQQENLLSSRSTLRDADIAQESSRYIQQQILQQASATLMATANQTPSIALQLI